MKEVIFQNLWTFEVSTQEGNIVPIYIIVGFRQSGRQHDQKLNNDTFYRPPVTPDQFMIANETYPDNAILMNYDDDD